MTGRKSNKSSTAKTKSEQPQSQSKTKSKDEVTYRTPTGWVMSGASPNHYQVNLDETTTHGGKRSACLSNKNADPDGFGTLMQTIKPDRYHDKRIKFSVWLKTDIAGWSQPWLRIDGAGANSSRHNTLRFDNCCNRSLVGNKDWTKYDLVLQVPKESGNIAFGIMICGVGRVWVDGIAIGEAQDSDADTDCPCYKTRGDEPRNLNFEED